MSNVTEIRALKRFARQINRPADKQTVNDLPGNSTVSKDEVLTLAYSDGSVKRLLGRGADGSILGNVNVFHMNGDFFRSMYLAAFISHPGLHNRPFMCRANLGYVVNHLNSAVIASGAPRSATVNLGAIPNSGASFVVLVDQLLNGVADVGFVNMYFHSNNRPLGDTTASYSVQHIRAQTTLFNPVNVMFDSLSLAVTPESGYTIEVDPVHTGPFTYNDNLKVHCYVAVKDRYDVGVLSTVWSAMSSNYLT
ncbi:VP10 [Liao ning virus]|uniref:VP10 n=1 Tax=Liao ning virus TaxID=246280 RepID=Q2TPU1_9REOV|nr:VP10 [Liao ning virus]AAW29093.1 VP10 [Liao ning virus]